MPTPRFSLLFLLAALLTGCASLAGTGPELDGTRIAGVWDAVAAPDDPDRNRAIQNGTLTEQLLVHRDGRIILQGEDRTEGAGPVRYDGTLDGRTARFDELDGAAELAVEGDGRLRLTDPRGRRTLYRRR
jgi:hypothetical protein